MTNDQWPMSSSLVFGHWSLGHSPDRLHLAEVRKVRRRVPGVGPVDEDRLAHEQPPVDIVLAPVAGIGAGRAVVAERQKLVFLQLHRSLQALTEQFINCLSRRM